MGTGPSAWRSESPTTAGDFAPAHSPGTTCAIDLEGPFITARYPFQPAAAFEDYERNPGRVLRLVIVPEE